MSESENPNPSGLCMCGCGERTSIAKSHDKRKGAVKGYPRRFINGHGRRAATLQAWTVDTASGCWVWTGPKHKREQGYGRVIREGRQILAHRWVYERERGPIPEGMHLHHRCENPSCVNPEHLEPMEGGEHVRHHRAGSCKTHCKLGHELAGENLYVDPRGLRSCRECRRLATARSRARKRAAT